MKNLKMQKIKDVDIYPLYRTDDYILQQIKEKKNFSIYVVHAISLETFFVQAFKIVVDS